MLAAAAIEPVVPAEGETAAETEGVEEEKKEVSELLVSNIEKLAGDVETVAVLADELADEKVERIRTKRVRDDKP